MNRPFESLDPSERQALARSATQKSRQALQHGDRRQARRYAEQAAALAPDLEDGWLILAALSSPRASLAYLQEALKANPSSQRARKGMQWALERMPPAEGDLQREAGSLTAAASPAPPPPTPGMRQALPSSQAASAPAVSSTRRTVYRIPAKTLPPQGMLPGVLPYALGLFFLSILFIAASFTPFYAQLWSDLSQQIDPYIAVYFPGVSAGVRQASPTQSPEVPALAPTQTPEGLLALLPNGTAIIETPALSTSAPEGEAPALPTNTPFLVPSATPTSAPSPTPLPTETPLPTATPTLEPTPLPAPTEPPPPEPTRVPKPTKVPKPKVVAGPGVRPANITLKDRWIDVDLSAQTTYAMQGDQIVRSFVVSTGRWPTVTVTGVFKVYVKYRSASMSGDDYYLPNVPYVMYFFKGYGLHGTYWHNNFGTPMSHGCVNLKTSDAAWLFDFASVGTVVNVHQ